MFARAIFGFPQDFGRYAMQFYTTNFQSRSGQTKIKNFKFTYFIYVIYYFLLFTLRYSYDTVKYTSRILDRRYSTTGSTLY